MVELCPDLGEEGIEDDFRAFTFIEDADGEAAGAGADEDVIAGDCGLEEHSLGEELAKGGCGFGAFGEVFLKHGEADSEDVEAGIDDAEAIEAFEEFWDGADAEGFRLLGDDEGVRGSNDIVGDAEEACGGIDEADIEAACGGVPQECADAGEV